MKGHLRLLLLYTIIVVVYQDFVSSHWHAYERPAPNEVNNRNYINVTNLSSLIENIKKYKLWPDLIRKQDLARGQTLIGFQEAIKIIWDHQHPVDCTKSKFIISKGWQSGFGSIVHVESFAFSFALDMGRVYLQSSNENLWQVRKSSFCKNRNITNIECYYEPWSSCTLSDAIGSKHVNMDQIVKSFPNIRDDGFIVHHNGSLSPPLSQEELQKLPVIVLLHTGHNIESSRFIPSILRPVVSMVPILPHRQYYWWRAVTAAYFLRPNQDTLHYLSTLRTLTIDEQDTCIGVYVRHGDKGAEMRVVPFRNYTETIDIMYANGLISTQSNSQKPIAVFLGTEDPVVVEEATYWGSISERYRVVYTSLVNRYSVGASQDHHTRRKFRDKEVVHHDLEYLSMLLNLEYALKCDAWVCTLASNWCRLIDELRATVGGKANYPFADLSAETCSAPPCIGSGLHDLGWR